MRIPLQASLRDASSPKGTPLGNAANFTVFRKAVPLGKVAANVVSRRMRVRANRQFLGNDPSSGAARHLPPKG